MKWVNGSIIETIASDALLPVSLCEAPCIFGSTTRGVDPGLVYTYWRILEIAKSIKTMYAGPGMNYCPVDVLVDVLAVNTLARRPLGQNTMPADVALMGAALERSGIARNEEYFLGRAEPDVDRAREWVDLMAELLRTEHEQRQAYAAAVALGEAQAAAWRAAHAGLEQFRRTGKCDTLPFDDLA